MDSKPEETQGSRNGSTAKKQPMPPFPAVSKTSVGVLSDCERRWGLQYQRSKVPVAIRADIALEAKLMPSAALVGQVVDDVITAALRKYVERGRWPRKALALASETVLQQYLDASATWIRLRKQRLPPAELRRQPIDRVYFGDPYSAAELVEIRERIAWLLEVWEDSEIREWATGFPVETWRVPEYGVTPWFMWEGVPVWSKFDFAIVAPGKTFIVDWKTGEAKGSTELAAKEQLHIYGKYAMETWGCSRDEIVLRTVWLSAGAERCVHDQGLDVETLARLYGLFRGVHADLRLRLERVGRGGERLYEEFPRTGFPNRCRWCPLRSCEGYAEAEERWKQGRGRDD